MVLQHVAVATLAPAPRVSLISLSQVLWIWLMSRSILRRDSGPARACTNTLDALHRCKRELGLMPSQCYPRKSYSGACDAAEFELKRCMAHAVDPASARVLYDASQAPPEHIYREST